MSKTPMDQMLEAVAWEVLPPQPTGDLPHATHCGVMDIGGFRLRVYRLSTGQAIINADDFEAFFELLSESPAGPVQPTDTNAAPVDQRRTE